MKNKILCYFCDSKDYEKLIEDDDKDHVESFYLKCKDCGNIFGFSANGEVHLDMRYQMKINMKNFQKLF